MTNMVGAAAKSRRWLMAVQLLHVMRSNGIDPNEITYTVILAEISRAKQVSYTLGLYTLIPSRIRLSAQSEFCRLDA